MSGQSKCKSAAFSQCTGCAEQTAVQRCNFFGKRKAQPRSAAITNCIHAVESIKNMGQITLRNADSVIADRNFRIIGQIACRYIDMSAVPAIFNRIFNQIIPMHSILGLYDAFSHMAARMRRLRNQRGAFADSPVCFDRHSHQADVKFCKKRLTKSDQADTIAKKIFGPGLPTSLMPNDIFRIGRRSPFEWI